MAPEIVAGLIGAAFAAGFIDSIAGGGGLVTLPALLLAGLPPLQALATNKVQGLFGAGTAALAYARSGLVDLRAQRGAALLAGAAAFAGALLAAAVPAGALRWALPAILLGIAGYFALRRDLDDTDRAARLSERAVTLTLVPLVAGYDGLVGPGAGAFYMLGFVTLAGMGVLRATARTKLLNFASNAGALLAFALIAPPLWPLGLAMGLAQVAGARLGARAAMRGGAKVIKPLLVLTSSALALKLILDLA